MAQFAPYTNSPANPSYLGLSKEPDKVKPNTAMKTLFEGIGDAFSTVVEGVDTLNKMDIEKEAYRQTDIEVNRDINDFESQLAGTPRPPQPSLTTEPPAQETDELSVDTKNLPPDLSSGVRDIDRLGQAKAAAKINNTDFQGRVHQIAQNLISRYPGYRSYIESRMDLATNTRAAAYRNQLNSLVQAQLSSTDKERDNWYKWVDQQGIFGNRIEEVRNSYGNPSEMAKWRTFASEIKTADNQMQSQQRRLDLELKSGNVTQERAFRVAELEADTELSKMSTAAIYDAGGSSISLSSIQKEITKVQTEGKGVANRERLAQLGALVGAAKNHYISMMEQKYAAANYNNGKDSVNSLVKDRQKLRQLINDKAQFFDRVAEQVGKENLALATSWLNTSKGIKETDTVGLLQRSRIIREFSAIEGALGQSASVVINSLLTSTDGKPGDKLQGILKDLHDLRLQQAATNGSGSLNDSVVNYNAASQKDPSLPAKPTPAFLNKEIQNIKTLLLHKDSTPEFKINAAKIITDPGTTDFIGQFSKDKQFDVWATLSGPDVAKAMKDTGNPEIWQRYRDWSENTFKRLFNTYIDTTSQAINDPRPYNIRFNPETGVLDYDRVAYGKALPPGANLRGAIPRDGTTVAIDRLNVGLKTLNHILEQDGIKLTPEYLQSLGLAGKKGAANPLIDTIINALVVPNEKVESSTPALFQQGAREAPTAGNQGTPATTLPGTPQNRTSEAPRGSETPSNQPIDPNKPQIQNSDGTVSTERTITIEGKDGGWVNIPTIINGKQLDPKEAEELYLQGKNTPTGQFQTLDEAKSSAQQRSDEIGRQIGPRSQYTPQPRNYGNLQFPMNVPGLAKDQILDRIKTAGIDINSVPKALRDKINNAGIFSTMNFTREDFDSIPDNQWRKLAGQVGAPVPGVTPKETMELASAAPQAQGLPQDIRNQVLNQATIANGPLSLEEPKGKPKATYTPLEVAKRFEGLHEHKDRKAIASFIEKAGGKKINPATTAWCAAFLNAVLGETGRQGTGSNLARSFLKWGVPTKEPTEGDIVVLKRTNNPTYGHVGLLVSQDKDTVTVLGGNTSNRVQSATFPKSQVLGYRTFDDNDKIPNNAQLNSGAAPAGLMSQAFPDQDTEETPLDSLKELEREMNVRNSLGLDRNMEPYTDTEDNMHQTLGSQQEDVIMDPRERNNPRPGRIIGDGTGGGAGPSSETIVGAAIKTRSGQIIEGRSHYDAINKLDQMPGARQYPVSDGFITSKGRYVTREEANEIAKKSEQLRKDFLQNSTHRRKLLSEDLKTP